MAKEPSGTSEAFLSGLEARGRIHGHRAFSSSDCIGASLARGSVHPGSFLNAGFFVRD